MPATALPPKTQLAYPRPPLVSDHAQLFQEARYDDGEPYAELADEDDEPA